jgi:hypothetical protein
MWDLAPISTFIIHLLNVDNTSFQYRTNFLVSQKVQAGKTQQKTLFLLHECVCARA